MAVAYVIMCNHCGETAPASPTLRGYRTMLRRRGWASVGRRAPHGSDYCPKHAHLAEDEVTPDAV